MGKFILSPSTCVMLKTWEILRKCFKSSDGVRISRQLGREEARDGQLREPGRNRNLVYALKFLFARGLKWCWPLAVRLFEKKRLVSIVLWCKGYCGWIYLLVKLVHHPALPLY